MGKGDAYGVFLGELKQVHKSMIHKNCVYVCMCVCILVYICRHIHTYMQIHTYTYAEILHIDTYLCTYIGR